MKYYESNCHNLIFNVNINIINIYKLILFKYVIINNSNV